MIINTSARWHSLNNSIVNYFYLCFRYFSSCSSQTVDTFLCFVIRIHFFFGTQIYFARGSRFLAASPFALTKK